MDPTFLIGLLGQLFGLGASANAGQRTRNFYDVPKDFGRTTGDTDFGQLLWDLPPELQAVLGPQLSQAARSVPGFALNAAQEAANRTALRSQKQYADTAVENVRGGATGAANDYVTRELSAPGGPQAISQATFDKLAAQEMERANGVAASRDRNLESEAARTGASPAAVAAARNANVWQNANDQSAAVRDLSIGRERANKEYGLNAARTGADIGSIFSNDLNNALYARAGLEQPVNLGRLGDSVASFATAGVNAANEADQALASNLIGFGGGLLNYAGSQANSRRAAAAQPSGWDLFAPTVAGQATGQGIGWLFS